MTNIVNLVASDQIIANMIIVGIDVNSSILTWVLEIRRDLCRTWMHLWYGFETAREHLTLLRSDFDLRGNFSYHPPQIYIRRL